MRSTLVVVSVLVGCGPEARNEGDGDCVNAYFVDADLDGHGDPLGDLVRGCSVPFGYAELGDDCDDTDALIHAHAAEICDGIDNDCDEDIDEDAVNALVWFADADGDQHGDSLVSLRSCTLPVGYSEVGGDCDDADVTVNPGASELCNGVDDDCDESIDIDDPSLVGGEVWYVDADFDTYGDAATGAVYCEQPAGTVDNAGDCNDGDIAIHPGVSEKCDNVDNDCDNLLDDDDSDLVSDLVFYADTDGDGLGDPAASKPDCETPAGYVENDDDCDDTTIEIGEALEYYWDYDGDGYGSTSYPPTATCTPEPEHVLAVGDCRPDYAGAYPGAPEICDYADNDCDHLEDGDDPDIVYDTWYADEDGDGFGDPAVSVASCYEGEGYAQVAGDCADTDSTINPIAVEYCDSIDNDCSGLADDGVVYVDWYGDADGDGFGDPTDVLNDCIAPSGYGLDASDCDDDSAAIHPDAEEVCSNDTDDDCDDHVDNCEISLDDADLTVFGSDGGRAQLGASIAGGDFDADGVADLLVGAPTEGDGGAAYVVYGPMTGVRNTGALAPPFSTSESLTRLGFAVGAGDADDDGIADLVLGAGDEYSTSYLFLGPLTAGHDVTVADATYDGPGYAVAVTPDLDGDALPDLVLSRTFAATIAPGSVYVFSGALTGAVDPDTDATYTYEQTTGAFGMGFTHIADSNGDGFDELAIGQTYAQEAGAVYPSGAVYVMEGGWAPGAYDVEVDALATIWGTTLSTFGDGMASADYDGDGTADLFVGARSGGTEVNAGFVHAFLGPLSGTMYAADSTTTWEGPHRVAEMRTLAVGDVDADGAVDLLMGAPSTSDGRGAAYLQLGFASGSINVTSLLSFQGASQGVAGTAVAVLPDWDGDGGSEIAVGAPLAEDRLGAAGGAVYVLQSGELGL
jgi:hypothetical protein